MQSKNVPIAKKLESQRTGFMAAMSDSGLKPTVVYHNLTPAELYEKVYKPAARSFKQHDRLIPTRHANA